MDGKVFEEEVRRIARALWPKRPGSGASAMYENQERDCVFEDDYLTHYIEVTTSKKLDKIKPDVGKMVKLRTIQAQKGKLMKLWIVTLDNPSPDQVTHCRKNKVDIMTLKQFRRHIIDGNNYSECRINYSFGSAVDPRSDSIDLSKIAYLPVKICGEEEGYTTVSKIVKEMQNKDYIGILLGDYGMGKSINIYQMYMSMLKEYRKSSSQALLPVVLNLREHWGQTSPEEALRRHGENIGFALPNQLVRAFNAGRLAIILDGFDEIAATPWTRHESAKSTAIRISSVELVRNIIGKSKSRNSVLIAGREHYFNSREEMIEAFHLNAKSVKYYRLDEFSDSEARNYLKEYGYIEANLPNWLPKRPLLLASLAANDIITTILEKTTEMCPEYAWDSMLQLVCDREAKIHKNLSSSGIREILELLANETRSSATNIGPITENHIAEAFRSVVGNYPDESARVLLNRLPCLASRNEGDGKRNFLDDQMLDVLRAGPVKKFIENPYVSLGAKDWQNGLGTLGASLVALKINKSNVKLIEIAIHEALLRWSSPTLAFDCLLVGQYSTPDEKEVCLGSNVISGGTCECLDLMNLPCPSVISVEDAIIGQLILPLIEIKGVTIENSTIEEVIGASSEEGLPIWMKANEVVKYDYQKSNAAILEESKRPMAIKVMLTILRKIYIQKGDGRRQDTLFRGLADDSKRYVLDIVEISLVSHHKSKRDNWLGFLLSSDCNPALLNSCDSSS